LKIQLAGNSCSWATGPRGTGWLSTMCNVPAVPVAVTVAVPTWDEVTVALAWLAELNSTDALLSDALPAVTASDALSRNWPVSDSVAAVPVQVVVGDAVTVLDG